jgi:hypothetical protein
MLPGKYDLPTIWRGSDYSAITFTWLGTNGAPFDLTNWQPYAKSKQIDFQPIVTDAINGVTIIQLSRLQTQDLKLGNESWDWIWTYPTGGPFTVITPPVLAGVVQIKEPETKPPVLMSAG